MLSETGQRGQIEMSSPEIVNLRQIRVLAGITSVSNICTSDDRMCFSSLYETFVTVQILPHFENH